jgi:hypothetical protein
MADFAGVPRRSAGQNLPADRIGSVVFAQFPIVHGHSARVFAWPGHCVAECRGKIPVAGDPTLPATLAIAPLLGAITVNAPSGPVASATGDAFGQVLRSVRDAASGLVRAAAPANDTQGPPAPGLTDLKAAIIGAASDQVAPAAAIVTGNSAASRTTGLAEKPVRAGKDDSRAAVAPVVAAVAVPPT